MSETSVHIPHTLVIGGARSGKSAMALKLAQNYLEPDKNRPSGLFVATASGRDTEMHLRIEAHKKERGERWHTVEEGIHVASAITSNLDSFRVVIVDCLTLWVSNILLNAPDMLDQQIASLEKAVAEAQSPVILVSNEVGLGIVPDNKLARDYRDILGTINQRFARICPRVIFMAAGIPLVLKEPKL